MRPKKFYPHNGQACTMLQIRYEITPKHVEKLLLLSFFEHNVYLDEFTTSELHEEMCHILRTKGEAYLLNYMPDDIYPVTLVKRMIKRIHIMYPWWFKDYRKKKRTKRPKNE